MPNDVFIVTILGKAVKVIHNNIYCTYLCIYVSTYKNSTPKYKHVKVDNAN